MRHLFLNNVLTTKRERIHLFLRSITLHLSHVFKGNSDRPDYFSTSTPSKHIHHQHVAQLPPFQNTPTIDTINLLQVVDC